MRKFVLDPQKLPISFIMGDKAYSGMPEGCTIEQNSMNITYTSVIDNVEVRAECVAYDDFDASEWIVYFTNKGSEKSPIFRAVNGINTVFEGENHKIYTGNGDYCVADGYSEAQTVLSYGYVFKQSPAGGRSCECAFPYHRITFDGHGHNIAVGWPGKWQSVFQRTEEGIHYSASQMDMGELYGSSIAILPGETIRTPLIVVVSFEGDLKHGINVWRRWYLKHVGTAKPYLHASYAPPGTMEFTHATEENQLPDLVIDSCASGGRRNDIETMRRSVPMHQTDSSYGNHPVQQSFNQTLYTWIPYFRGFGASWERADGSYEGSGPMKDVPVFDEYNILASFAPCVYFSPVVNVAQTEEDYAKAREYISLFYKVAPILCTADFYALTPYHKSRFKWTAWQFDEPEKEHGIFEVIRNNAAPDESLTVSPRLRDGKYLFRNMRTGEEFIHEGGQITFTQPVRSVTFWEYSKL